MLFLAFLFIALAILLFWLAKREQNAAGLPQGRVIYADTSRWSPVESPLYDARSGLTGRPDYLVDDGDYIIPVEVKSSQIHARPYDSHIFQLAAYCRLVERTYAKRPPYGIIHYPNRTFMIDYSRELEAALESLLEEMHAHDTDADLNRSHGSIARCQACGFRSICDQRLS